MADVSLAALLRAVETWQQADRINTDAALVPAESALAAVDISALQQLAHQHAEALQAGLGAHGETHNVLGPAVRAAADFLDGAGE